MKTKKSNTNTKTHILAKKMYIHMNAHTKEQYFPPQKQIVALRTNCLSLNLLVVQADCLAFKRANSTNNSKNLFFWKNCARNAKNQREKTKRRKTKTKTKRNISFDFIFSSWVNCSVWEYFSLAPRFVFVQMRQNETFSNKSQTVVVIRLTASP